MTVSDDFNRANGGLGAAWGTRAGSPAIVSNQLQDATDDGPTGYYYVYETDVGSVDMYARAQVLSNPQANAGSNVGPAVRHRATVITGYQFASNFGTAQALWRTNAGSETNISNFTATVASGDVLQIEAVSRLIRAKVNSALVHLFQDTSGSFVSDGQRGCINGYNADNSDIVIADNFVAGPLTDLLAPYLVDWSAQTARSTSASMTPTIPVTPATGDLVVVHAIIRSTSETISAPAGEGWSQVELASGNSLRAYLFAKLWGQGATDDTTPTFTRTGTTGAFVTAAIYRNPAHATAPWTSVSSAIVASGQQSNAASATATAPSVSHDGTHRTLVRLFSSADDNALNAASEGILVFGGAAYDATDIAQAMSVREDVTVTTNTGTATTTESVNGNDANNGITLVLAIPTSTNGTATPAAIAATTTLPAPSIVGVSSAQPAAIATTTTLPAPTPSGASATSPSTISTPVAMPAPSVLGQSTAQPATIASAATVPSPGVSTGAGPSTVASTSTLPAPSATGAGTATPATIAAVVTIPAASAEAPATVQPATIVAAVSLPTPTATVSATAEPAAVAALTDLPTPGLSTGVTPGTITAIASVPTPSVSAGGSVSVTPSTIQAIVSVLTPGISTGAGPGAVAGTASLPAPTVTGGSGATATPQTIAALVTLPAPAVTGQTHGTATPATIALVVLLPQATATGGSGPELIGRVVSISRASATVAATSGARQSVDQEVTTS